MPKITRKGVFASSNTSGLQPSSAPSDIEFAEPTPSIEECDRVLGSFLRQWNQIEASLFDLLHRLLGTHLTASNIVYSSGINQQTMRDIIGALSAQRLNDKDIAAVESLLARIAKCATKRNRLVHGVWRISIVINKNQPNTATWERFSQPVDPRQLQAMSGKNRNQKIFDAYVFPISRIDQIIVEAKTLSDDLRAFIDRAVLSPFQDLVPLQF